MYDVYVLRSYVFIIVGQKSQSAILEKQSRAVSIWFVD